MASPTVDQATALQTAFEHFNDTLFAGTLPNVMLAFSRNANVIGGYFTPGQWRFSLDDGEPPLAELPEIAININLMKHADLVHFYTTLLHEMIHLQEFTYRPDEMPQDGSHSVWFREYSRLSGLEVRDVPGDETGRLVTTALIDGGAAEQAIRSLPAHAILPWEASELHLPDAPSEQNVTVNVQVQQPIAVGHADDKPVTVEKPPDATTYFCPICGLKVWAARGKKLMCGDDSKFMVEMK